VPLYQLVSLLESERYRLVRTVCDLQALVLHELQTIGIDAKQHLAMLYKPLARRNPKRERLHEEALQAYLYCRLRDRLLPAVLASGHTTIFSDRESLAARNTRNDVKIQTLSVSGRPLTVIVEIKWSDHPDVSTGQIEQLAKQYLLENGLTHGIYLVGWCGEAAPWKENALGQPPTERSRLDSWQRALKRQSELLREEYPELDVQTFLLDLSWAPAE